MAAGGVTMLRDVVRLSVGSPAVRTSSPEKPAVTSFARYGVGGLVLCLGFDLWSGQWFSPFLRTVPREARLDPQKHLPGPPCS